MSRIKIEIEDIVGIAGNDYRLERRVPGGYFLRSVDSPSVVEFFEDAELELTDDEGLLSFRLELEPIPAKGLEDALQRQAMCEALERALATGQVNLTDYSLRALAPVLHEAASRVARRAQGPSPAKQGDLSVINVPSPTTMRRWLRRYDGTAVSVLPVQRGHGVRRGDPLQDFSRRVAEAFRRAANSYVGARRMPMSVAYREFRRDLLSGTECGGHAGHALKIPSASTFQRVLMEILDVPELRDGRRQRDRSRAA